MKKKGYYEYTPQIYPRKLWVMYNTSEEEIDKCFTNMKGEPLVHNGEPMNEGNYGGMVYDECMNKAGKYFGNLVVFPKKSDIFENYREIDVLKGKTLVSVDRGLYDSNDALFFKTADGEFYIMTHYQECCEDVYIDDICGDFADLLNEEILTAEELNNDYPVDEECIEDTYTWTFYHLATFHGDVTIRWFGTSNGYYSESAEFYKISEEDYNVHAKNK